MEQPNNGTMEYVVWGLSVIAALFVGGFLKSYMSKKGENLATQEDVAMEKLNAEIDGISELVRKDISR